MKKKIVFSIIFILLLSLVIASCVDANKNIIIKNIEDFRNTTFKSKPKGSYNEYVDKNKNNNITEDVIKIENLTQPDETSPGAFTIYNKNEIITQDEGYISYNVNVSKPGFYNILIEHKQVIKENINGITFTGKRAEIERLIKLNDKIPFNEAASIKFMRIYSDDYDKLKGFKEVNGRKRPIFDKNYAGSEIRPNQIEKPVYVKSFVGDYERTIIEPYKFYFEKGINKLTIEAIREPAIIKSIKLVKPNNPLPYKKQLALWKKEGLDIVKNSKIVHEAEYMYEKGTPVLVPLSDTQSPNVYPYNKGINNKLNIVGVWGWRLPGYWLSYNVEVEKEGLYQLTLRGKEELKEGSFVSREIYINNKIPFEEASYIPLKYSGKLNNYTLGTKKDPYLFHLKKGSNIVRIHVSLGNVGELINETKLAMNELNKAYLDLIKYTSVNPDRYRDYKIEKNIPSLKPTLIKSQERLKTVIENYKKISGGGQGKTAVLNTLINQINRFLKDIESIIYELNSFQANISALGTWVQTEQEQPFTLDSIIFHDPNVKLKRARDNFFESLWQNITKFIYSFSNKNSFGGKKGKNRIKVWVLSGRDNAQILRRIIDESFIKNDISVDLELVPKDALLRATVSGQGPDIALMVPEGTPIDFAFRGAAYDLTNFKDFDTLKEEFYESGIEPFTFKTKGHTGVYALPEQQVFPVFFYRTDIFDEMGLEAPKTWQELYSVINTLNNNNLDFFVESGTKALTNLEAGVVSNAIDSGFFGTVLYQHGGKYYNADMNKSALTQPRAMEAFKMFSELFTSYHVPIEADFVNRFRSGEMAAGITNYSIYNTLAVFAPEISGKWKISEVPKLEGPNAYDENGNYVGDKVASLVPSASMIMTSAKNKDACWEFLKWWLSSETQVLYANELETIMGAAGRYTTANKKAISQLSWPRKDALVLSEMLKKSKGVPQVPGGYMTLRQYTYALLSVVNDSNNPYETLNEYVIDINKEIKKKREEFNLEDE